MLRDPIFGKDRVCAVVAGRTAGEAIRQLALARRQTRTIEIRLDWLGSPAEGRHLLSWIKINRNRFGLSANLIATCRARKAGGKFNGSSIAQLSLLRSAILAGCGWVDLELEMVEEVPGFTLDLYTGSARRILSFHDFRGLANAESLKRIVQRMKDISASQGFDAIKIAAKCETLRDALRLLAVAHQHRNVIAIPMGEAAAPMRVLALREGSALSYAPVAEETAPGQIRLPEAIDLSCGGNLSRKTRVYGVIGDPVAHSLSPALHNAGFRARKIDAIYLPFHVVDLPDFLRVVRRLGIAGFSITLPHKVTVLSYLDGCDSLAETIGAVNTVAVRENGKLIGYNTDSIGLLRALDGKLRIRGSRVLILGAGGVARAAAFTLKRAGASVTICSRRIEKARWLARDAGAEALRPGDLRRAFFDAVINATPVGMYPRLNESPIGAAELNCALALDTIYRPQRTKFLSLAAQRGIKTVSGVEMFLAQGIAQWEIWMKRRAPVNAMRRAVLAALNRDEEKSDKRK